MLGGYGEWREKEASFLTNSERRKPERVRSSQAKYLKGTKVRIKIKRKNMKIIHEIDEITTGEDYNYFDEDGKLHKSLCDGFYADFKRNGYTRLKIYGYATRRGLNNKIDSLIEKGIVKMVKKGGELETN